MALAAWVSGSLLGGLVAAPAAATSGVILRKAHAEYTPKLSGTDPIVILAIGSGARPGENISHSLADSLHLIYLNPARRRATIVGIPRDSYVPIPGGGSSKINSSMVIGGPSLLIDTIEQSFGTRIDYYALTTFWGITDMIDSIGGLKINVPFPMYDSYSRSAFDPGPQRMSGRDVLAFSRDRHSLSQGDLGRQENGGRVILAALTQFRREFREDPSRIFSWIGAGLRNLDTDVPIGDLLDLAFASSLISPERVDNVVLPGSSGSAGGFSVVFLNDGQVDSMFADLSPDGLLRKANIPPSPTANEV
jgi:LCP family protein required for cell wall assembly